MGSDTLVEDNETLCPFSLCVNVSSKGRWTTEIQCLSLEQGYWSDKQLHYCGFPYPDLFFFIAQNIFQRTSDYQTSSRHTAVVDLWFRDLWQCIAMVIENLDNFDNNLATFPTQWYRVYNCKEPNKMSLPSCWRVWSHGEADWWVPVIESNQSNRSNELFCNYHLTRPINGRWFWRW